MYELDLLAKKVSALQHQISELHSLPDLIKENTLATESLEEKLQNSNLDISALISGQPSNCQPNDTSPPQNAQQVPKNAIFGMAQNLEPQFVYRFVRSARRFMPDVDIVIWTDEQTLAKQDLVQIFNDFGVQYIVFDIARDLGDQFKGYHPSSYRWMLMNRWVRKKAISMGKDPYNYILFSDVRDAVFQADIFQILQGETGFFAMLEDKRISIRQCGWNSKWVKSCFGEVELQKVGSNIISCSGTSVASYSDALEYLDMLDSYLAQNSRCEQNGIDQGIHNYFLYSGDLENRVSKLHRVSNESGELVASVQSMTTVHRNAYGQVVNQQGKPVAVVHQYDRSNDLVDQYAKEYPWIPPNKRIIHK